MKIVKVICAEYLTAYITDTGKVLFAPWDYSIGKPKLIDSTLSNIVDGAGGQYACILLDKNGTAFILNNDKTTTQIPGSGYQKVFAAFKGYFLLKSGKLFAFGADVLRVNGGANITTPKQISTRNFSKISVACSTATNDFTLFAIATDGTLWKQPYNAAMVQVPVSGSVRDIASMGSSAVVAETTNNDLFFVFGYKPEILGLPWNQSAIVSIKSQFSSKGCVFPSKKLSGNTTTLHIIDANNNLFGTGDNAQGEVGAGNIFSLRYAEKPYTWAWQLVPGAYQAVIQIPGKWADIFSGETIAFYKYAFDLNGNLFSWGRNKSQSLGNGLTTNAATQSTYPNALDMPRPSYVDPLNTEWTVIPFNPANPPVQVPVAAPVTPPPPVTKQRYAVKIIYNDNSEQVL